MMSITSMRIQLYHSSSGLKLELWLLLCRIKMDSMMSHIIQHIAHKYIDTKIHGSLCIGYVHGCTKSFIMNTKCTYHHSFMIQALSPTKFTTIKCSFSIGYKEGYPSMKSLVN